MKIRQLYVEEVYNSVDCYISTETETVPNLSLTIKELFERYQEGAALDLSHPYSDYDGDSADDLDSDGSIPVELDACDVYELQQRKAKFMADKYEEIKKRKAGVGNVETGDSEDVSQTDAGADASDSSQASD